MDQQVVVDIVKFVVVMGGGLIAQGAYLKGKIEATHSDVVETKEDIKILKANVRYEDTCDAMHVGLDTRLTRVEGIVNHG